MDNKKHYLITSITLGLVAAFSAAIIGVTNLVTRDRIKENEIKKINEGIIEIFGDDAKASEKKELIKEYKYVEYYYDVANKDEESIIGYAFRTSGKNSYGTISLVIGFLRLGGEFNGLSIITNEQTYATTLVENYIEPLEAGERELDDVYCGATYGAKLVRDMVNDAREAYLEVTNG